MSQQVIRDMIAELKDKPYQPFAFSELADIPSRRGEQTMREYITILEELHRRRYVPNKLLDIGANTGFFTFRLAQTFPSCTITAVERDRQTASILLAQARWKNITNLEMVAGDLFHAQGQFDVTVMLNVHHWIAHELRWDTVRGIMQDLARRTRLLFFQTAHAESEARDPDTGADLRVMEIKNGAEVLAHLKAAGFKNPRMLLRSFPKPRYLIVAEGQ